MDSVAKRLGYFIENQGLKVSKLEMQLGLSNGRISKAIDRNSGIKPEIINNIVSKFPHLSKDWLETGQGNMLVYENVKNAHAANEEESWRIKYEKIVSENLGLLKENKALFDRVIEQKKLIEMYEAKIKDLNSIIDKKKSA